MNLREMCEGLLRVAAGIVEGGEQAFPVFCFEDRDGKKSMTMVMWGGNREKTLALALLRAMFKERGVTAYACVVEGWSSSVKPDPQGRAEFKTPPSQDPNRGEVLQAFAVSVDGEKVCATREITRNPTVVSPVSWQEQVGGAFTELLEEDYEIVRKVN